MKLSIKILFILSVLMMVNCKSNGSTRPEAVASDSTATEQAVYQTILTRASVRQYQNKPVEKAKIEKLLRAGMAAPSAVDRRPWHLVVVTSRAKLEELAQKTPNASSAKSAPLAIVVCGDMNKALEGNSHDFWIQDCSAVSENILLEAHAMGLGAVWTGTYPSQERCAAVREVLGLSEDLVPLNTIVIGYPAENAQPKDKWNPDDVTYIE